MNPSTYEPFTDLFGFLKPIEGLRNEICGTPVDYSPDFFYSYERSSPSFTMVDDGTNALILFNNSPSNCGGPISGH